MKIITIPQKESGTGSIHDIASDMYDREIKFPKNAEFAIVLASYYGDYYTTHKSESAAIRQSQKTGQSHIIMDKHGTTYVIDWDGKLQKYDSDINLDFDADDHSWVDELIEKE